MLAPTAYSDGVPQHIPSTELNWRRTLTLLPRWLARLVLWIAQRENFTHSRNRREQGTMKRLFTICMILSCCPNFTLAQGIQGKVKLIGKATIVTTGHSVTLSWNASQGATSYCIYRGTTHGGPYVKLASGIIGTSYADVHITHNRTLYYVSTAVSGGNESGYSNETVVVIP